MSYQPAKLFRLLVPLVFVTAGIRSLPAAEMPVNTSTTPEGVIFGWLGALPKAPVPTVFFFATTMEASLSLQGYSDGPKTLGPGVLCVSVDLPAHGTDVRATDAHKSITGWRGRIDHGEDVAADLARRASAVLDYLVAKGHTNPTKVAVFGTSRGGFMALHFAAADSRVRNIVGFAPVTDLLYLREFQGDADTALAHGLSASRLSDRLYDRGIWIIIGSTDFRVGTQGAIEFTQRVVASARAHGLKQPAIELHVMPTDGHHVPDDSYAVAARWLLGRWNHPK